MNARTTASLALLIGLAPGLASAVQTRPLRLRIAGAVAPAAAATPGRCDADARSARPSPPRSERPARVAPLFRRNGTLALDTETRAQSLRPASAGERARSRPRRALDDAARAKVSCS